MSRKDVVTGISRAQITPTNAAQEQKNKPRAKAGLGENFQGEMPRPCGHPSSLKSLAAGVGASLGRILNNRQAPRFGVHLRMMQALPYCLAYVSCVLPLLMPVERSRHIRPVAGPREEEL